MKKIFVHDMKIYHIAIFYFAKRNHIAIVETKESHYLSQKERNISIQKIFFKQKSIKSYRNYEKQ